MNIRMSRLCEVTKSALWGLFLLPALAVAADAPVLSLSPTQNPSVEYRLVPTQNVYTFLLLDTKSGFMMRVQWGLDESHRLVSPLFVDCTGMTANDPGDHVGRYTLQPTQNIWEFLLLDQDNGRVWQVQWTVDGKGDTCVKIPFSIPAATPGTPK